MKGLPTFEQVSAVVEYDPETGLFRRKVYLGGKVWDKWTAGSAHNGYRRVHVRGRQHLAHRLAWVLMTRAWPSAEIDHIDGDKSNNRWSNLRDATRSLNNQNLREASRRSGTGILGVSYDPRYVKPFYARIGINGGHVYIGRFETIELARDAYLKAKRELHPGYVEMVNGDNRRAA